MPIYPGVTNLGAATTQDHSMLIRVQDCSQPYTWQRARWSLSSSWPQRCWLQPWCMSHEVMMVQCTPSTKTQISRSCMTWLWQYRGDIAVQAFKDGIIVYIIMCRGKHSTCDDQFVMGYGHQAYIHQQHWACPIWIYSPTCAWMSLCLYPHPYLSMQLTSSQLSSSLSSLSCMGTHILYLSSVRLSFDLSSTACATHCILTVSLASCLSKPFLTQPDSGYLCF